MRTNRVRFYVEIELAHTEGRVAPPRRLEELIQESFQEMAEPGEHYTFGADDQYSSETTYTVVSSKVCPIDVHTARRLVGPARVGADEETGPATWAEVAPVASSPVLAEPREVDILPRGRWVPEEPPAGIPMKKGWRTLELPKDPYRFGDVVEVSIIEPGRGRHEGKLRPCIWVAEDKIRHWHAVAKMTTLDRFENGLARQPLQWKGGIYTKGSHLWGDRLTWVPERAIEKLLGHLDDDDLQAVINTHRSELRPLGIDVD